MVKVKVENETPAGKFKRLATSRTRAVIDKIRILSHCANPSTYEYSEEQVNKIFRAIEDELKKAKAKFKFSIEDNNDQFSL